MNTFPSVSTAARKFDFEWAKATSVMNPVKPLSRVRSEVLRRLIILTELLTRPKRFKLIKKFVVNELM